MSDIGDKIFNVAPTYGNTVLFYPVTLNTVIKYRYRYSTRPNSIPVRKEKTVWKDMPETKGPRSSDGSNHAMRKGTGTGKWEYHLL
jgi:hypothetical protein